MYFPDSIRKSRSDLKRSQYYISYLAGRKQTLSQEGDPRSDSWLLAKIRQVSISTHFQFNAV